MFKINRLDHVAIRVKDLEKSAQWYNEHLGLIKHQVDEWGDFPIFMLAGKTGIALFPEQIEGHGSASIFKNVVVDHFAFHLDQKEFEQAKEHLTSKNISYNSQDHFYFHSIYIKDPDGHTVELTTPTDKAANFYKL